MRVVSRPSIAPSIFSERIRGAGAQGIEYLGCVGLDLSLASTKSVCIVGAAKNLPLALAVRRAQGGRRARGDFGQSDFGQSTETRPLMFWMANRAWDVRLLISLSFRTWIPIVAFVLACWAPLVSELS
jgi:hypothetical protein